MHKKTEVEAKVSQKNVTTETSTMHVVIIMITQVVQII